MTKRTEAKPIIKFQGWFLDVSTSREGIFLWVKPQNKEKVIKIHQDFSPEFFAVPKTHVSGDFKRLKKILSSHPNIKKVRLCEKYVKLEDSKKTPLFGVSVIKPSVFKKTVKEIDELKFFTLYNTDIPIAQMYFYTEELFPMSFCEFEIKCERSKSNSKPIFTLLSLNLKDDNEKLFYEFPPLSAVWLDITVQKKDIKPYFNEPLKSATISIIKKERNKNIPRADGEKKKEKIVINTGNEREKLRRITKTIEILDPDIILTHKGDEFVFPYLAARASINHISSEIYFSRTKTPLKYCIFDVSGSNNSDHYMSYGIIRRRSKTQVYFTGRFHLDTSAYGSLHFSEGNIPGVIEVARLSRISLQRLCRITIGGALHSIQFYYAYKLDHLIPPFKKNPEDFSNALCLVEGDRGGHIFEPKIGVFSQVIELDFSSMYPSLMAYYNISSETLNCECCKDDGTGIKVPGLKFHICSKREGIISKSIKLPLEKRLKCKQHVRETGSARYKFIDIALKWILVVSFGYLGFRNARFGKIEAHQTVCAFAREFLMRSSEIAKKYGCRIIHGIVDSLWLQDTRGRSPKEFEKITKKIAQEITNETKIPMSWDGRFNIIVFLPSRAEPDVPALNHYWGIKSDGDKKIRGIEIRRRDIPQIIKRAQREFIEVFDCVTSVDAFKKKIPKVEQKLFSYAKEINSGDLSREDLTIIQRISRRPSEYKVNSYQAVAARQLEKAGEIASPGKKVKYIILNADADPDFPERKVILTDLFDPERHTYDKEKYLELLQRAFENIFPFKFPHLEEKINSLKTQNNRTQKDLFHFV
ncbi:MAG: putative DNA polymerase (Inactivated B2-family) [Promethearchaeota archaeon]|nr:MAG: putative DNA polymerase (Inactivated B2-family) [Candidatus Lokiarchaeota archaeon]